MDLAMGARTAILLVLVVALPRWSAAAEGASALRPGETRVVGGGASSFRGEPISLDFKDADVKDVLRFLSEFGGFNLVLDASVQGRITLKLTDVPWDQALDVILRNNGLAAEMEGNILRAAAMSVLAREEAEQRRLAEEQALSGPLVTVTVALSYAKAADVAKILEKSLSPRGSIVVDRRTNTLVIQDIASRQDAIVAESSGLDR